MKRKLVQDAYIRVCRDSGFTLDAMRAARLAGDAIGIPPLELWVALGDMGTMHSIASGEHPSCKAKQPA